MAFFILLRMPFVDAGCPAGRPTVSLTLSPPTAGVPTLLYLGRLGPAGEAASTALGLSYQA